MKWSRRRIWIEARGFLLIILLSVLTIYGFCRECWSFQQIPWQALSQSAMAWVLLSYGNNFINTYLDNKISWIHQTFVRLLIGFIAMVGYTTLAMYAQAYFFYWILDRPLVSPQDLSSNLLPTLVITAFMTTIMLGRSFLLSWRESAINEEKLKRENMRSRFESLKSQVNPHFLFNSLNVLTELVYLNQDKAVDFIHQLSAVYRYVLENREHEVVPLEEELAFLEKFFFLQKIRFQEGLAIDIQVQSKDSQLPPMALQLLVENAIKHNIVSEEQPLHIRIIEKDDYLEVTNNLQIKRLHEPSSGVGLPNIKERYSYLSDKEVFVVRTDTLFMVRLPLLKTRKHAHITH
jgi:sensor histidine kinase YesM